MDFSVENNYYKKYYAQDFSELNKLIKRIRNSLVTGKKLSVLNINLDKILNFKDENFYFAITLFQEFNEPLRVISRKKTLEEVLNRIISQIRINKRFKDFEVSDSSKTRILFEWVTKREKVEIKKIHLEGEFDEYRYEAGITGIEASYNGKNSVWMPTDAFVKNEKNLSPAIHYLGKTLGITVGMTGTVNGKAAYVKKVSGIETYLLRSFAFVTYNDDLLPLYRGNVLYDDFKIEETIELLKTSNNYLVNNMKPDGRYEYYYNPTLDNNIDHEHPGRKDLDDLYYNDLRHLGATLFLINMRDAGYSDELENIKKALDWVTNITCFYKNPQGEEAAYIFYNTKSKLGGEAVALITFMKYRMQTKDTSYDRYIEGWTRHLLSRLDEEGEFLGYYIHPDYNNGEPLLTLSREDKRETFSFFYPGEALMGFALFAKHYDKNEKLKTEVIEKSKIAMDWIINKRPIYYSEMFTELPSDAWLMQSIEEWSHVEGFLEDSAINFVFQDAKAMIEHMYKKDESPYIDYEGTMYIEFGNHYYLSGSRLEGLIAAYYLAKTLNNKMTEEIYDACLISAKTQLQLYVTDKNNYAHRNPKKSIGGLKFKATRQWLRIDSIQHTGNFLLRTIKAIKSHDCA